VSVLGPAVGVLAHGISYGKDLPIPFWLAQYGAAAALLASFLLLGRWWPRARFADADARGRPLPGWLARSVDAPRTRGVLAGVGLAAALWLVVVAAAGPPNPAANPAPTWLYVWLWVGLIPASLLAGPVWRRLNPIRPLARLLDRLAGIDHDADQQRPLPERLDYWPAAAGLAAFAWLELVHEARFEASTILTFTPEGDQAKPVGGDDGVELGVRAELGQDCLDVVAHGVQRQVQFAGDPPRVGTGGQPCEHLPFARAQPWCLGGRSGGRSGGRLGGRARAAVGAVWLPGATDDVEHGTQRVVFGQEGVGPGTAGALGQVGSGVAGQHDQLCARVEVAQLGDQAQPVAVGQVQVDDGDVDVVGRGLGEGIARGVGDGHAAQVRLGVEREGEHVGEHPVVVDQQHGPLAHPSPSAGLAASPGRGRGPWAGQGDDGSWPGH
jgi:hypothetical protein